VDAVRLAIQPLDIRAAPRRSRSRRPRDGGPTLSLSLARLDAAALGLPFWLRLDDAGINTVP
jgi:hypothetical protein